MAKILFTNPFIKSLLEAPDCEHTDQKISGLVIRKQGKTLTWALRYSVNGKQRRIKLGDYPLITLQKARELALNNLQLVTQKIDPVVEQQRTSSKGITFAEVAAGWLNSLSENKKSAVYIRKSGKFVDLITRSEVGKILIKDVKVYDLENFLNKYFNTPFKHNRLRSAITAIFNRALRHEYIERNPAIGLPRAIETERNEVFSVETYKAIVKQAEILNTKESLSILLMAFTGCRPTDAFRARWCDFDLNEGTWTRIATQTKQRKTQVVELSNKTISLLKNIPKQAEIWVFPSHSRSGHIEDVRKTWKKICKMADVVGNLYQLRKFVATQLIKQGVNIKQLQKIMAWENAATPLKHYVKVGKGECKEQLDRLMENF